MDNTDKAFSLQKSFPLHYLAKTGDFEELELSLSNNPIGATQQLIRFDFKGRTILHYAASGVNLTGGDKCVECILKFLNELEGESKNNFANTAVRRQTVRVQRQQWKGNDTQGTINFINMKDVDGISAIHLAAKNENADIVRTLLMHSADVLSVCKDGKQALGVVYSKTPSAVTELLNRSVSFDYGVDSENFIKSERSYCLDFTVVIGDPIDNSRRRESIQDVHYQETMCLNSVNEKDSTIRKAILTHPLVRFFVVKKVAKLIWMIYASLILQLLWISLYIWHAADIFYSCCEIQDISNKLQNNRTIDCSEFPFQFGTDPAWVGADLMIAREAHDSVVKCITARRTLGRAIPIAFITIYVLMNILVKLVIFRRAYIKIQNCLLWTFTVFVLITLFPAMGIFKLQFQLAAFAIVLGALVILEMVNKHVYWAIYIRVLITVIKRFVAILPLFLFIILAFSTSLRMLFSSSHPPIKSLRNAVMQVFSSIANGKVEWTEGHNYQDAVDHNFQASGFIMFIVFYVTMILLLFRILIGFVVADTKKIQEEEELNEISQDLKQIFIFESITSSTVYKWFSSFGCLQFLIGFRERFMLCNKNRMQLWLSESEIPEHLRKPMRVLASKNPAKHRTIELVEPPSPGVSNFNNSHFNHPSQLNENEGSGNRNIVLISDRDNNDNDIPSSTV